MRFTSWFLTSALMFTSFASAAEKVAEPVTLEGVLAYLQRHPDIRTVDDFLSRLPASFLSQHTLMHTSRSLQAATPEKPRAIVFGPDARLILAFSSDPAGDHYDSVEMIGFHDDSASFEFREVKFPENSRRPAVEVSPKNPALCLSCHARDPRPNWEHYSSWPGAFGSNDDEFADKDEPVMPRLREFLTTAQTQPRFRWLSGLSSGYENAGFRTKVTHNIDFTERAAVLNFRRVARLARASRDWQAYKFAAMGMIWCESKVADFFPETLQAVFSPYYERMKRLYGTQDRLRYAFEPRGVAVRDWFMNFNSDDDKLSFGTPGWPHWEVSGALVDGDRELQEFFRVDQREYVGARFPIADPIDRHDGCSRLAARSQQALEALAR